MATVNYWKEIHQGVAHWNCWRAKHPQYYIDLSNSDFSHLSLAGINLSCTNLKNSTFVNTDLNGAILNGSCAFSTIFTGANLTSAKISHTNLTTSVLIGTDLSYAHLDDVNLSDANLFQTLLVNATILNTNFGGASLFGTNFSNSHMSRCTFVRTNLRTSIGLASCEHGFASSLDLGTIAESGQLPEGFLEHCGISSSNILKLRKCGILKALEQPSCFISYSQHDRDFAVDLYKDLLKCGVSCWLAEKDLSTGDYLQKIFEQIPENLKLVVILSHRSLQSKWVQAETEMALRLEDRFSKDPNKRVGISTLIPIRIDDAILKKETAPKWAKRIRKRNILDFTIPTKRDENLKKLVRDIRLGFDARFEGNYPVE